MMAFLAVRAYRAQDQNGPPIHYINLNDNNPIVKENIACEEGVFAYMYINAVYYMDVPMLLVLLRQPPNFYLPKSSKAVPQASTDPPAFHKTHGRNQNARGARDAFHHDGSNG